MNWPEPITNTYPLAPFVKQENELGRSIARHPTRPWWSWFCLDPNTRLANQTEKSNPTTARYGWLRRDQAFILVETIENCLMAAIFNEDLKKKFDPHGFEFAEAADAENPMPHPGYRLGQIWASASGESTLILRLDDGKPIARTWVTNNGEFWGGAGVSHLVELELPNEYTYLVHDPACPWLAPWGPTASPTTMNAAAEAPRD